MTQYCIFLGGNIINVISAESDKAAAKVIAAMYAHPEAFLAVPSDQADQKAKLLSIKMLEESCKARGIE